jgi:peptidoglycan/xylan/chitin deacetylase (PgdA/CDA1 family)
VSTPPTPRPLRRRHRSRRLALLAVGLVALVAGACELTGGGRDSIETPVAAAAGDAGAATTTTAATTTSIEVNDLLAPPPTVVPELSTENGLAPQIRRVDTTDRVIFITIDDGQLRDPAVLDYMVGLGLPFTAFLTEPMAKADPEFWQGSQSAWGIIETHTINHPDLLKASEATQRREICEPADTFEELFGRRPTLFRPPYGNSSDSVRRIAASCGYDAVVLWTGSTNNGKLTMQDVELEPGDIILMHYRDTLRADLDDVLARARAEGFTIGRLQDYLSPGR